MPEETWRVPTTEESQDEGCIVTVSGENITWVDCYETVNWRSPRDNKLAILAPAMYNLLREHEDAFGSIFQSKVLEIIAVIEEATDAELAKRT
jgi:hypothetical protein